MKMPGFEKIEIGVHNEIANAQDYRISEVFEEITDFPNVDNFLVYSYSKIRKRCEVYHIDLDFIDNFEAETNQAFSAALMYAMLHAKSTLQILDQQVKFPPRDKRKNIGDLVDTLSKASNLVEKSLVDLRKYSEYKDIFEARGQLDRVRLYFLELQQRFEGDKGSRNNSRNTINHGFLRAVYKIYCVAIPEYKDHFAGSLHDYELYGGSFDSGCIGRLYRSCLACTVYNKSSFPSTSLKNILFNK